ncbi:MAG: hypothetical protein ACI94Y_000809 [Maribacter sp.]|jgi:hypothetical protein
MKNLIILIVFMATTNLSISQSQHTWDGTKDTSVIISSNETITFQIDYEDGLSVGGDALLNSCSPGQILTAERKGIKLVISLCNQIDTFDMGPGFVKIKNDNQKSITINQGEDSEDPAPVRINPGELERNLYMDAYTLSYGASDVKKDLMKIWNINPTTNKFFEGAEFSSLFSEGADLAEDKSSGILGFNATAIADGFAKFLVSRVKKEMAISFFNGLKKKITGDEFKDAQVLFSSTYSTLDLIDEKIYDLDTYLPTLKQSFEYDVEKLPKAFSSVIKDSTSQISKLLDKENKESRFTVSSILDFGIEIKEEKHIGRALADLDIDNNPSRESADLNYLGSLQTLQLFSEAMRDTFQNKEDPYWLSQEKLDTLIKNPKFLKCFIGLINQKAIKENITFKTNRLTKLLNASVSDVENIEKIITDFFNVSKEINKINNNEIKSLSIDETRIAYIEYFQLSDKIISVIKPINHFTKMMTDEEVEGILNLSKHSVGLAKGIAVKQYSVGLLHLSSILTELNNKKGVLNPILSIVGKQGMFIAQVAEADNSNQVSAIIENFAAPIGSWRDKRTAKWNFAFDSYVGAGGYLMDKDGKSTLNASVPTPIGFSLTSPLLSNNFTIMTSIVDLGPIVAFRFLDGDTEISNIFLRELVAPGIFLSWNIDKTINRDFLLKFNVGYQQFPLLDKVNAMSNTVSLTKESGFTASINVNVPIMTLINQKK